MKLRALYRFAVLFALAVAFGIAIRGFVVIVNLLLPRKEPPATHATNVVEHIPIERQNKLEIHGTGFTYTNAYEVPNKSRVQADTNDFPTLTFSNDDSATGLYKSSSNAVIFAHSGRNVFTLGKGYEKAEDPNEVTITFHGKDGSVWTPTWTKK